MTNVNELRQRIALISKKGKHELKTRDERESRIENFYHGNTSSDVVGHNYTDFSFSFVGPNKEKSEHGKRFTKDKIKSRKKDKKLGREHKQLDEGLANEQYIETGEPINPSKFKGKRINTDLKRRLARIYEP